MEIIAEVNGQIRGQRRGIEDPTCPKMGIRERREWRHTRGECRAGMESALRVIEENLAKIHFVE